MSIAAPSSSRFAALQYRAGHTPLHGLETRAKILAAAIAIAGVLAAPHPRGYLPLIVLMVAASVIGRIGLAQVWRAFGPMIILFAIGSLITAVLIPGPVAFGVGPLHITKPGLDLVLRGDVQTLVILYTSALMTITSAPSAIGNALLWYLGPLRRLRVPVDDMTVMVSLGLAFLPLLQQELQRILLAQRVRGADLRRGSMESRLLNVLALLPPLLAGNLRRAEELAVAMEARGFVPGAPRTVLNGGRAGLEDVLAVGVTVLCAVAALLL